MMEKQSAHRDLTVQIIKRNDHSSDLKFWQEKTPQERVNAVEFLREHYYSLCGFTAIPRITRDIQFRARH